MQNMSISMSTGKGKGASSVGVLPLPFFSGSLALGCGQKLSGCQRCGMP